MGSEHLWEGLEGTRVPTTPLPQPELIFSGPGFWLLMGQHAQGVDGHSATLCDSGRASVCCRGLSQPWG